MKYRFINNKLPNVNAIIMLCRENDNIIGVVESIFDNKFTLLLLDRNGKIIVDMYDNWIQINTDNLDMLRNNYKIFIHGDIDNIINDAYAIFYNKYINDK